MADGVDKDFKKQTPMHKIEKPPFYAAWATPILHDTLTGLRTNTATEVIDTRGEVIPASIARANRRAASPSTGWRGVSCSAASPGALRRRTRPER